MNLFRAPAAVRAAKTLDRSLFSRTLPTTVAAIRENKLISKYRKELTASQEILFVEKLNFIIPNPDPTLASQGGKCFVLRPEVKSDGKDNSLYLC